MAERIPAHPLRTGTWVFRGWKSLMARVAEIGESYYDELNRLWLVPVRYTNKQYGILRVEELKLRGVPGVTHVTELQAHTDPYNDLIRNSRAMPEIIMVSGDSMRVGVVDDVYEICLRIRRHKHSIVHEEMVLIA